MSVKKTSLPILWDKIEKMPLNHALWNTMYHPEAWVKLAYVEDDGVYVQLFVAEKEPKAIYFKDQDPVYKDNCLECFLNCDPSHHDEYLNFEMNANGAMLVGFGKDRHKRQSLPFDFHPCPYHNDEGWGVTLMIPESFILQYYDTIADTWKGNFYKCGDDCKPAHYLSWSKVNEEQPNFHTAQWFGVLNVE